MAAALNRFDIDLEWWFDFVFTRLGDVRLSTRQLVRVLDLRDFAKDACDFASDETERTLQQSFRRALAELPKVDSILLDDHADLDPSALIGNATTTSDTARILLLSLRHCRYHLQNTFFRAPSLQNIIYLDISAVPGSIGPLLQPGLLPELRILKITDKEVDDSTLRSLVSLYRRRLWSLDVSNNKISDDSVDLLGRVCFPATQLRSEAYFRVEGKAILEDKGTLQYGQFLRVEESETSGSFSHPERFYVDSPIYLAQPDQGPQEYQAFRSDGIQPIRHDVADTASAVLSEGDTAVEDLRCSRGLTHLHISNTGVSSEGLQKLVRLSNGHIEQLSCDSMPLLPLSGDYSTVWPASATLRGILGAAHVFRPVLSPNLRVLRIHHSLITHIPTLDVEGLSTLARIHVSENDILPRVDDAFAQVWVPDMNPRLTSLTLTGVPRRSSGPLVNRLIRFLKRLSEQERSIRDASPVASSWRGPGMLKGLRHLRLEFESDPMQEGFSAAEDLDAEELMNSGDPGFSFFGNQWSAGVATPRTTESDMRDNANSSHGASDGLDSHSDREDEEYAIYHNQWNGEAFSIKVWIGKAAASAPVIADYRRLAMLRGVQDGVGPATPAQVAAGAPPDSYIFHTAWCLAIMPNNLATPPTTQLLGMKDVLQELKRYRLEGRSQYSALMKQRTASGPAPLGHPHYFWTGDLEVSTQEPAPHARPSQYWR